jgi:hypothetical protein
MNQVTYLINQGNQNNYTNNSVGYYDDEYYDQYYDFDYDEQQYEYEDAVGRPYLDSAIPIPSIFYTVSRVAKAMKTLRQEEVHKLKAATLEARRIAYEAKIFAAEVKARNNDFKNEQLSFFRSQLEKQSLDEVAKAVYDKIYTDATEVKIANEILLSKIPKFSSARLAKMKAIEDDAKPEADAKFYTWRNGNKASATNRQAWGHRRSGGGKGHKTTLQELNSEVLSAELAAARRLRRKAIAEKEEVEETQRSITIARVNAQRAEMEAKKAAEFAAANPIVEAEVVEETEGQKFRREELEAFRVKTATTEYVFEASVAIASDPSGWTKVNTKETKNSKIAKQIEKALYIAPRETDDAVSVAEAVAPKPMSKKVTATQMCKSVSKGDKCPYPPGKCNFAHGYDELKPKNCANRCCRFIKKIGDKYVNKGRKICTYIHEAETKSNLCQRIGVRVDVSITSNKITASIKIEGITPMSDRVLKPYSASRAWAPLDVRG